MKSFRVIWDHLESFQSWGDKLALYKDAKLLKNALYFFVRSVLQTWEIVNQLTLGVNWKNWCMYYMCMHLILLLPMLWCIVFLYYWIHLNTSLIHTRLHFNASFDKYSRLDEEMIIKTGFFPHPKRSQTHFLVKTPWTFFLFVCYTANIYRG